MGVAVSERMYGDFPGKNIIDAPPTYHSEICRAMTWLGQQPDTMFFGQGVGNTGTSMSDTFAGVDANRRVEMPVAEEMQVGMCVGMSLHGVVPICVIPRWNFALRAADQIINHMDRLPIYSAGAWRPKVILRIAAPSTHPFNPGAQHDGDFTAAFRMMLCETFVLDLDEAADVVPAYQRAYHRECSTILVEHTHLYRNARAAAG